MHIHTERKVAKRTPVADHAGVLLYHADRDKVRQLIATGRVAVIGTTKRIRGLRFIGPDPALQLSGSRRRRGIGEPHRHENYYNVRGVWHIDRIPDTCRPLFEIVVTQCLRQRHAA